MQASKMSKSLVLGFLPLLLLTMLLLVGCSGGNENNKVTLEKYNQIETGMTLEEVEAILGEGTENASTEAGDVNIKSYQWINSDGSNIQIMFQDGKVNTKAQAGLK